MARIMLFTLIHVLASLSVLTAQEQLMCSKFDVPGCYCVEDKYRGLEVCCEDIKDEATLRQILEQLKDTNFTSLRLINLQLPYLPRGVFKNSAIKNLIIEGSPTLMSLAPNSTNGVSVFDGLEEHLEWFAIVDNPQMATMQLRELRLLRKLRILCIHNCPVDMSRGISWIKRLPLQDVVIRKTSTKNELERKAFSYMRNLTQFNLSGHKNLTKISRDIFPQPAEHLHSLILSYNAIEEIPSDMFDGMPKLEFINIKGNRILNFYESTFRPVWSHLRFLALLGNPIHCDEKIMWLVKELEKDSETPVDFEGDFLTCASPEKLKGHLIAFLNTDLESGNSVHM